MRKVLVVGSTGNLGSQITQALLERNCHPRLLVRSGSRQKLNPEIATATEVVEDLGGAFDGIDTVVSAVQGGPETIIDTQLELLRGARAAGVSRFIPSDFSMNLFGLAEGENINSDWRREFARRAEEERGSVDVVHVLQGCFLDEGVLFGFLNAIDLDRNEAYLWGDGNADMQFTTYADTAAYTAEAALDEQPVPSRFYIAGDSLNFHRLVAEVSTGLGRPLAVQRLGTLAELDTEIQTRMSREPANPMAWLPLMYWRGMLNGKGALGPLMNQRYPAIQPTTVREYVSELAHHPTARA